MENTGLSFTVIRGGGRRDSDLLVNLLQDTGAPALIVLAERYGMPRVPGLNKDNLITRILKALSADQQEELKQELIAARFGALTVKELVDMTLDFDEQRYPQFGRPRTDDLSGMDAALYEGGPDRWVYTMHGYDVTIDSGRRTMSCDCTYFAFAARRQALCKHLARAFQLIPSSYARTALVDLLLAREFGGADVPEWHFEGPRAA